MADEGFDMFHMAEFVAKPEMGHEPFCHWDNRKKDRVYAKLASIINTRYQDEVFRVTVSRSREPTQTQLRRVGALGQVR